MSAGERDIQETQGTNANEKGYEFVANKACSFHQLTPLPSLSCTTSRPLLDCLATSVLRIRLPTDPPTLISISVFIPFSVQPQFQQPVVEVVAEAGYKQCHAAQQTQVPAMQTRDVGSLHGWGSLKDGSMLMRVCMRVCACVCVHACVCVSGLTSEHPHPNHADRETQMCVFGRCKQPKLRTV